MRRAAGIRRLLLAAAARAARRDLPARAAAAAGPRLQPAIGATTNSSGGISLLALAAAAAHARALATTATTTPTPPPPNQKQVRVLKCKRGDATPVSQAVALLVSSDLLPRGALHANLAALADDLREAVAAMGVAPATRRDREQYAQRERAPRSGGGAGASSSGNNQQRQHNQQQQPQQQHRRPALGLASSALEAGDAAEKDLPPEQTLRSEPFTTTEVAAFLEVCRRSAGFAGEDEAAAAASSSSSSSSSSLLMTDPQQHDADALVVSAQQQQFAESALALFETLAGAMRGLVARMPPDELPPLLWALARVYVSRGGGGCDPEPLLRLLLDEATTALTSSPSSSPPASSSGAAKKGGGGSGKYHAPFIGEGGGGGGKAQQQQQQQQQQRGENSAAAAAENDGDAEEEGDDDDDAAGGLSAVANEELPIVAAALADLEHRDPLLLTELAEAVLERRAEFSPGELAALAEAMAAARRCFFDARVLRALGDEAAARLQETDSPLGAAGTPAAAERAMLGARRVAAALKACGFEHAGVEKAVGGGAGP